MARTLGPTAATSAQLRRCATEAVAGMRIPARERLSPFGGRNVHEHTVIEHRDRLFHIVAGRCWPAELGRIHHRNRSADGGPA